MINQPVIKVTANFERNLESIARFLLEADAISAFDDLLDGLTETVIPNLERFPDIGKLFFRRPVGSIESSNGVDVLSKRLHGEKGELREYVFSDYLLLYVRYEQVIYLLSVKHHRQLSFDLTSHWIQF